MGRQENFLIVLAGIALWLDVDERELSRIVPRLRSPSTSGACVPNVRLMAEASACTVGGHKQEPPDSSLRQPVYGGGNNLPMPIHQLGSVRFIKTDRPSPERLREIKLEDLVRSRYIQLC